jgi:glycosyltransferase involved in cell wall biosynthesis
VSTNGFGSHNGHADGITTRPLRIALIAPPVAPIPPQGYAGTERIIAVLAEGLHARGHHVTVFASGDSDLPCELVPVTDRSAWARGMSGTLRPLIDISVARAWRESQRFDVINAHVETAALLMSRHSGVPVISTFHQRLDGDGVADLLDDFPDAPLIAISDSQRRWHPRSNWVATIHHGLDFSGTPFREQPGDYLLLVGRVTPEKGIREAIDIAKTTGRTLVVAAKMREPEELALFREVVDPAIAAGVVDWRGEVAGPERDELMAGARATLMLGAWPEPFGLVAIESMATGTPVIARRAGGCTETIEHAVTGFLVDDQHEARLAIERVATLSRPAIRARARERFSADRMVDAYEAAYRQVIATAGTSPRPLEEAPALRPVHATPTRIRAQHGRSSRDGRRPEMVPEAT